MRNPRTDAQKIAAAFERDHTHHIGKKITYANAQKKLEHLVAMAGGAVGSSNAPLLLMEYSGFLEPVIAPDRVRPHEYIIRGSVKVSLRELPDSELIAMQHAMVNEMEKRLLEAAENDGH